MLPPSCIAHGRGAASERITAVSGTDRQGVFLKKYSSESMFVAALNRHLSEAGYLVTRIESGSTCLGVPDMYVVKPHKDFWLEAKRVKTPLQETNKIPWRPGQVAWMLNHYRYMKEPCFTIIAFDTNICLVPMTRIFTDNIVTLNDMSNVWDSVREVFL
jgi:hypothetical protein